MSQSWGTHRNAIFTINPRLVQAQLIDVDATIKRSGTGFYTPIPEHEHALMVLPISAIREIRLLECGQSIVNPLYIVPTPEVVEEFQTIFKKQLAFLERLYNEGKSMTSNQRQNELIGVIEQTAEFFHARLGRENPFNMTLVQLCNRYGGSNLSNEQLSKYSSTTTVLDVLKCDGDELFMKHNHYRKLLGQKSLREAIERANEENGYGSPRSSNSFD
ncbi:hypothetical protein [Legionella spiritensis]|uniref:hypothetical protein n=1 Tax=Legionella spiritensis TaxID=452 RepID=UPI000F708D81|nr:hypothetical protein [Legionella spiritensis]VEG92494.1 Uncharacterised protein [Legionella spiritensis]